MSGGKCDRVTDTLGYHAIGLSLEDTGTTEGLLHWCSGVIKAGHFSVSKFNYWSTGVLLGVLPLLPDGKLGPFDA